jgi:hypothetical protein
MDRNEALRVATERAKVAGVELKSVLPEPTYIYHKDFHFLDEPLIERQNKREAAIAAKTAATKQASSNEIDSSSTAATNENIDNGIMGESAGVNVVGNKGPAGKLIAKLK